MNSSMNMICRLSKIWNADEGDNSHDPTLLHDIIFFVLVQTPNMAR